MDPVLWFIKSLIILYVTFYIFSIFLQKNSRWAIPVLWCGTIIACILRYYSTSSYGIHSIAGLPIFSVGVVGALYSSKNYKGIHFSIFPLSFCFLVVSTLITLEPRFVANFVHVLADYIVVGIIITLFTKFRPKIKLPLILSLISFDIYLVHFKVLMFMSKATSEMSLLIFIVATGICAVLLLFLRTRLIRI